MKCLMDNRNMYIIHLIFAAHRRVIAKMTANAIMLDCGETHDREFS